MSISYIKIENFKSIKNSFVKITDINLLIGENGSGKSNVLEAIDYFFKNLTSSAERDDIFDKNNHFSNEVSITVAYDLTQFVNIAKSKKIFYAGSDDLEKTNYPGYYKAIMSLTTHKNNNIVSVKMTQIKGKKIKWNCSYEERQLLKSLFPVYSINSRNLDVVTWDYIWDMVGEIAKVSNKERKILETDISNFLLDKNNPIGKKIEKIVEIFNLSDVSIRRTTSKEFAEKLVQVFLSGDEFYQKGRNLGYYSTGTNAVKYIEMLLMIIDTISKTKLKEPVILIDEPEISLHHQYIDDLGRIICSMISKSNIIIATHSTRLTKNIIVGADSVFIYNIKLLSGYSEISQLKRFIQYSPKSKYRVTDDHINSYFSRGMLFVEGETELELFSNPYLKELFPILYKIDIFQAISQEPILNIMNPSKVGSHIPYVLLIDMDKAVKFNVTSKKIELQKQYIKENRKEWLRYRNAKELNIYLYHQYKRLVAASEKLRIRYYLPFYSCKDENYYNFLGAVKKYLMEYNVFAFQNTVEGALINMKTFDFVLLFLEEKVPKKHFDKFMLLLDKHYKNDQLNILRYAFKGKSDLLQYKIINEAKFEGQESVQCIQGPLDKTSGWVSEFIDMFFAEKTGLKEELSINNFRKYLEKDSEKKALQKDFKYHFPELYSLMSYIYDIMK